MYRGNYKQVVKLEYASISTCRPFLCHLGLLQDGMGDRNGSV
jgi:hypothetical protein